MQRTAMYHIALVTARRFEVSIRELWDDNRSVRVVTARMTGYWLAKQLTGAPNCEVAKAFDRDHATVRQGYERVEGWMRRDPAYRRKVLSLIAELETDLAAAEQAFIATLNDIRAQDYRGPRFGPLVQPAEKAQRKGDSDLAITAAPL